MNNLAILQAIRTSTIIAIKDILCKHDSETMNVTDLDTVQIWPDEDLPISSGPYTLDRVYIKYDAVFVDSSSSSASRTDNAGRLSTDVLVDILEFLENYEETIWRKADENKEPEDILVCEFCGSPRILRRSWTDPNTDRVNHNMDSDDKDDKWCEACQEHVHFTSKSKFEKKLDDWARDKGLAWTEDVTYAQKCETYNNLN